tara:strand:+ start:12458 stop:12574 length:117 start_codon:yes stop_codon:yes gene_type:complete
MTDTPFTRATAAVLAEIACGEEPFSASPPVREFMEGLE